MIRLLNIIVLCCVFSTISLAQNCTITCSGASPCTIDWDALTCDETGSAPQVGDEIIITNGVTVEVTDSNEEFDGNVRLKDGANLNFPTNSDKLDLTNGSSNCGRYIYIEEGGEILGSSASNQLRICGTTIARGGGSCTDDPADPPMSGDAPPYCINGDGLHGEVGIDENGVNTLLPIELIYFSGKPFLQGVQLDWATATEIDFDFFEVYHSRDGYYFDKVGIQERKGGEGKTTKYTFFHETESMGYDYYRLKGIDIDGSFESSNIIAVYTYHR